MTMNPSQTTGASTHTDTTSSRLLAGLKVQDGEAWHRLTEIYGPLVYYWCARGGVPSQDVADVFQEVFAAVWSGIEGFDHEPRRGRFRGWLWTITRNKICDHFRRLAQRPDLPGGDQERLAQLATAERLSDEPSDPQQHRQWVGVFRRAVTVVQGEFERNTWEAFWRTTVERQLSREVAAALGISPAAVRQAKARVLHRLREELGDLLL
jgi:RNA polymerase sigma-70 factor (ECF subfamily)